MMLTPRRRRGQQDEKRSKLKTGRFQQIGHKENMCLAIPARIEQFFGEDSAIVNLGGVRKEISLALVEDVAVGDYVIVHVGFALQRLDPEEAAQTLALFAEIGGAAST